MVIRMEIIRELIIVTLMEIIMVHKMEI